MSRSCRPVTSGAPSLRMRSTRWVWCWEGDDEVGAEGGEVSGLRAARIRGGVDGWVMSPTRVVMPGNAEIGCKSIATMRTFSRGCSSSVAGAESVSRSSQSPSWDASSEVVEGS